MSDLPFIKRNGRSTVSAIFTALCEPPFRCSTKTLVEIIYKDYEDGGPETAEDVIRTMVCYFNKRARKRRLGLRIRPSSESGWHYSIHIVKEK